MSKSKFSIGLVLSCRFTAVAELSVFFTLTVPVGSFPSPLVLGRSGGVAMDSHFGVEMFLPINNFS